MSSKAMKLSGMVILNQDKSLTFEGQVHDGQPFQVDNLREWDVKLTDDFLPSRTRVKGFLFVTQMGQVGDVVYLTLPKASMVHGKNLNVNAANVSAAHQKIEDFNPQKRTPNAEEKTNEFG